MVVKRGAALAAGLVVVAGLVGGCAQKPGVAATATLVSCGGEASAVFSTDSDGTVSWSCGDSPAVRGDSMTISNADVADVVALAEALGGAFTGVDAIQALIEMRTVLRVAGEEGVTISDDEATEWLDQRGYEVSDGAMVVAKYSIVADRASAVGTTEGLTEEQVSAIDAGFIAAVTSLDIVVNPRFGSFDPEQFAILPPTWVQQETPLVGS